MKHILHGCLALLFAFVLSAFAAAPSEHAGGWISSAEAASHPEVAQRELKKDKGYEVSDVYNRAHHIIYGSKAPVGPDGRTRIAVIVNGDEDLVVEDRVKNIMYSQIRKKFPRENFAVMKGTDINTMLLQMAEDRYVSEGPAARNNGGPDIDGVPVEKPSVGNSRVNVPEQPSSQPRGIADFGRTELATAGRACNYNYVLLVTLSEGHDHKYDHGPFTHTTNSNIWLRIRFVDVASGDYLYRNDIVTSGKTHNGHVNGRVFEDSVANGMKEAMNDIAILED
ncbi:hypothetical protein [uncultured Selenomonas sp.]|uniref:hypothetical protein n=1 Tax=uncultured Selenomonas sp. TaxID=159275 RepID=UPI0025DD33A2|nr:hypothetical protein [uncultured Selenomonas sp.]